MAMMQPMNGMPKMKMQLSQLMCWYQFSQVMGKSVMCGFDGLYLGFLFGSDLDAMLEGWELRN